MQTIRKQLVRDMPDHSRIIANLEVRGDEGQLSPSFSLTGEIYEARKNASGATRQRQGRDIDAGGMIHEELLRAFPTLAGFARMHLADSRTGEPMYALENGWYHYSHGAVETAASLLRVDVSQLQGIETREQFAAFVDSQRDRWEQEARMARAFVESL